MLELQYFFLISVGIIELGLIFSIYKLKKTLKESTNTFANLKRPLEIMKCDIRQLANYGHNLARLITNLIKETKQPYDLKIKGKTPLGDVNVKIDLEEAVM